MRIKMKKIFAALLCAVLLLQHIPAKVRADATDISITGYTCSYGNKKIDDIRKDDDFTLKLELQNTTDSEITDVHVFVDSAFSFYGNDVILGKLAKDSSGTLTLELVYKGTGNELRLTFNYNRDNDGTKEADSFTRSIFIREANDRSNDDDDDGPSVPVDTTKNKPILGLSGEEDLPQLLAGRSSSLTLPIYNSSSHSARNVVFTLEAEDKAIQPYLSDKIALTTSLDRLEARKTKYVTFDLKVSRGAPDGTYAMKLSYQYTNANRDPYTSEETFYLKIINNRIAVPRLDIDSIDYGGESIAPGGKFDLRLNVTNIGALAAKDVRISLKGLSGEGLTLAGGTDVTYLAGIDPYGTSAITFAMELSQSVKGGNQAVTVGMEYRDELNNKYTEESQVFIPVRYDGEGRVELLLENVVSPTGPMPAEKDFTIGFDLVNKGPGKADGVKVTLTCDEKIIPKSLNSISVGALETEQTRSMDFVLWAASEAETKNYPVAINVEYEELVGGEKVKNSFTQYVGVYVENGSDKSVPKVIVSQYSFEPADVTAGEDFTLNLSFLNTSGGTAISNIKVSLSSEEGTFTPTNSSNTFYISGIGPNKSVEKSLLLHARPDAEPKSHILTVDFEYEDDKATALTAKETLSIPVKQNPRLVTGELSVPPEAFTGQPSQVFLEFYNMGKSTLYNLMISVEGDFDTQNSSYFVGNFEPGSSDYFEGTVIPNTAGQTVGNVVFSFEDSTGKPVEIKKEFTMNAMEMPQMPPEGMEIYGPEGSLPGEGPQFNILFIIIPAVVVLAAGVAVFIILRKRRLKGREMMLDE